VSAEVTGLTARRLHAVLAREQVRARMPSLVAGVVREGRLAWSGSRGVATGAGPADADLQYRIGSLTKTVTAVLVLQLRDEGRLRLHDPVGDHLPGVGFADRTIGSLLSHAGGLPSEPAGDWWERSPGVSVDRLLAGVGGQPAPFGPGATFHYSNLAYGLLGELVARLRGQSWWEATRERVLAPLGMRRTTYHPSAPVAAGYSVHPFAGTLTREPAHDTAAMAPAGQLWSTVSDLAAYASFLVEGHHEVLRSATLAEMATPQTGTTAAGLSDGYGLGLRLVPHGEVTLVGHTGSMPGYLAGLFVDRTAGTGAVCLANGTAGLRADGLVRDLLAELERCEPAVPAAWQPVAAVPPQVEEVLGVWHWGNTGQVFSFDGTEVVVTPLGSGAPLHRFRPESDGSLVGTAGYHHGETLHVHRREDGTVSHLTCATFVYTRTPYDPDAPIPGGVPGS
jgi:CubicO group peptidase (beta-lactamase class C family)